MSLLFDIDLNTFKKLTTSGANIFRYETKNHIKFYYVSNTIIYRTIISRPSDVMVYNLLLQGMPPSVRVINVIEPHLVQMQILELLGEISLKLEEAITKNAEEEISNEPS